MCVPVYVFHLDLAPFLAAYDVCNVCATLWWTYIPCLVAVSTSELKILFFLGRQDRHASRQTDNSNARYSQHTFQVGHNNIGQEEHLSSHGKDSMFTNLVAFQNNLTSLLCLMALSSIFQYVMMVLKFGHPCYGQIGVFHMSQFF